MIVWVSDASSVEGRDGDFSRPFSHLGDALAVCRPGAAIMIKPGHVEMNTTPITARAEGVTIIGHGAQSSRPQICFQSVGKIILAAPGVTVSNLILETYDAIALCLDVRGDRAVIEGCAFRGRWKQHIACEAAQKTRVIQCDFDGGPLIEGDHMLGRFGVVQNAKAPRSANREPGYVSFRAAAPRGPARLERVA